MCALPSRLLFNRCHGLRWRTANAGGLTELVRSTPAWGQEHVRDEQVARLGTTVGAMALRAPASGLMERLTSLPEGHIFVFGSNTEGDHGGGAAADAVRHFGAVMGQAAGLQGQSYAIPTVDYSRRGRPPAAARRTSDVRPRLPAFRLGAPGADLPRDARSGAVSRGIESAESRRSFATRCGAATQHRVAGGVPGSSGASADIDGRRMICDCRLDSKYPAMASLRCRRCGLVYHQSEPWRPTQMAPPPPIKSSWVMSLRNRLGTSSATKCNLPFSTRTLVGFDGGSFLQQRATSGTVGLST